MNGRKVNRAFLISILLYTGCIFGLVYVLPELFSGIVINNLICETIVILPGILFAAFSGERLPEFLHLKKLKPGTILAVIPFTMFSMPFITLINLISQFFVENTAAAMMEGYQVTEMPFWQLWLSIGVFAPFCEETACRGVFYRGYKKTGGAFKAMLLSSLLFALVHMNINQAMYAFVMGIMAVLLVEASGSLWASVLYHGLINSSQVLLMYGVLKANPGAYSEAVKAMDRDLMIYGLAGYLVIAALTLPLAWAILVWISGNEGRRGVLGTVWKEEKIDSRSQINDNQGETDMSENTGKKDKLITVPLILALILCVAIITLTMLPVNS